MWYLIAGLILTVIEVLIFKKFKKEAESKTGSDEEQFAKFKNITNISILVFFPGWLLTVGLLYLVTSNVNILLINKNEADIFLISPGFFFWLLPSILLGFVICALIISYAIKLFLKEDYETYSDYEYSRAGYKNRKNTERLTIFLLTIFALASIIYIYLGFGFYHKFIDEEIVVNSFWQVQERRYQYNQVETIKTYTHSENKNGNLEPNHYFVVTFSDNTEIRSNQLQELSESELKGIVEFISLKSNKKIQKLKVEEF